MTARTDMIALGDVRLEVERRGAGPPLLLLPGEEMLEKDAPFVDALARNHEVIIPSPPGFGRSDRPDWIVSVDDISYLYLDLLDALDIRSAAVVGCSLGGWLAAEVATKSCARIAKLVLIAPYGLKTGAALEPEIADIWALDPARVAALKWHDPAKGKRDFTAMPDEALAIVARNNESLIRFGWQPYLHNPQLRFRLHRIAVPTLVVWGEQDGIVAPAYGRAYADLIPNANFASVPAAGHYPHLEQSDSTLGQIMRFLA